MAKANLHPKCPAGKNKTDRTPGIEIKSAGNFSPAL
jgi:hypothetical protein